MITITDNAVNHLRSLLQERDDAGSGAGLRVGIDRGGCSGLQYEMSFGQPQPGDEITERDGVRVFVDEGSLVHLRGAVIDYHDDLTGTGFRIQNPNAKRTCGCGTSFEPAAVEAGVAANHA